MPRQPSVFLRAGRRRSAAPGFFTVMMASARNQHALALNADGTLNACTNGAMPGSKVTIFINGMGQTPACAGNRRD